MNQKTIVQGSPALCQETGKAILLLEMEHPEIEKMFKGRKVEDVKNDLYKMVMDKYAPNPDEALAIKYQRKKIKGIEAFRKLSYEDVAAIRILDYLENTGKSITDFNLNDKIIINAPFDHLWRGINENAGIINVDFVEDMNNLFKQFKGEVDAKPSKEKVLEWMERYPNGLREDIVEQRKINKERIIRLIIKEIEDGKIISNRFKFSNGMSAEEKFKQANVWWDDYRFHLKFAIRDPELLNEMLDKTLDKLTMKILRKAKDIGIPFFVNPYYLSLLDTTAQIDQTIRAYVIYSLDLVNEFGKIRSWEKEDIVVPGEPNAAGWLLPKAHMIHRRYPEVAILIPQTVGRACGGLCTSCQRFYGFQSGIFQFDLKSLEPGKTWKDDLKDVMNYFVNDSQLRDILITGGDALMSSNKDLRDVFNAVCEMAQEKIEKNKNRPDGEKYAELVRVRIGTRLPVYLPQRIDPELVEILSEFKKKASKLGVKQFVIQTHFESSLEITPEVKEGIEKLLSSGFMVTNQLVFTAPASRRGHTAKLRKDLNEIGVLPYYNFTVKGGRENISAFATNARNVMEMEEEKVFGEVPEQFNDEIQKFPLDAKNMVKNIAELQRKANLPFLSTDKSVFNLPGIGKSITYRVIGITPYGRRILEFDHDMYRRHSPITEELGAVLVTESRSIKNYLDQLEELGENIEEYSSLWHYSVGMTETRPSIYEYPEQLGVTEEMTNIICMHKK